MEQKNILHYFLEASTSKYADFNGRARRMEYWGFVLINMIIGMIVGVIDNFIFESQAVLTQWFTLGRLLSIGLFIPGVAVGVRRFHDTGRNGWIPIAFGVFSLGVIAFPIQRFIGYFSSDSFTENISTLVIPLIVIGVTFFILGIWALIVDFTEGDRGPNKYGPDPKNPELGNEIDAIGQE